MSKLSDSGANNLHCDYKKNDQIHYYTDDKTNWKGSNIFFTFATVTSDDSIPE